MAFFHRIFTFFQTGSIASAGTPHQINNFVSPIKSVQPPKQNSAGSLELENYQESPIYENLAPQASHSPPMHQQFHEIQVQHNNPLSHYANNTSSNNHQNTNGQNMHDQVEIHEYEEYHPNNPNQPPSNISPENNSNPQFSKETISTGQVNNIRKNFEFWGAKKQVKSASVKSNQTQRDRNNFGSTQNFQPPSKPLPSPMSQPKSFGFMPKSQSTMSLPEGINQPDFGAARMTPDGNFGQGNPNFGVLEEQTMEEIIDNTENTPSGMPIQPQYISITQDTRATGTPTLQTPMGSQNFGSNGNLNQSLENTLTTNNTNTNTDSWN